MSGAMYVLAVFLPIFLAVLIPLVKWKNKKLMMVYAECVVLLTSALVFHILGHADGESRIFGKAEGENRADSGGRPYQGVCSAGVVFVAACDPLCIRVYAASA